MIQCLAVSPWHCNTSLISYNSQGGICSLNLHLICTTTIKYKIKHKIVNCEKTDSVTSHDLYPLPCHKLSHFLRPLPPWSVTYFMDGLFPCRYLWSTVEAFIIPAFKTYLTINKRISKYKYESLSKRVSVTVRIDNDIIISERWLSLNNLNMNSCLLAAILIQNNTQVYISLCILDPLLVGYCCNLI